ncbi:MULTISPECIES: FumA C-terminus/TtdB family hydratase beta subunit [Neobacillus]|uniref:Fumarate hydratase C-terminal domain-containing protein n=1 Tax=Neobacillus rhizophilus TaxID=2833579 RepID=A0A942U7W9_9BACI|nr:MULTISPECIES: FumA C-terminus/TtdB family hydratase beta subunit [Neobacillus]MBS4214567.1 fumarate hydratase C-terminal domain-containing protein [Neobacillus rhizophilus]MBU8918471.1 FumA C-terminus/TtdB family hydratase beta subunit [Bacillus sp. FJAT-29953]
MAEYRLKTPLTDEDIQMLQIGDQVLLTGTIYMARDAAHKRMVDLLESGQSLPVNLRGEVIFYAGPCPPKPGQIIGPVAPTTAYRMDPYAPAMYEYGVKGTIGKGPRREMVKEACKQYGAISFAAVGGLSTILSRRVTDVEVVAYEDLGPEAIRRLEVEDFPLLVAYDAHGQDLYEQEIAKYENYNKNANKGVGI